MSAKSAFDALFGRVLSNDVEIELSGGLNFKNGMVARINPVTGLTEVSFGDALDHRLITIPDNHGVAGLGPYATAHDRQSAVLTAADIDKIARQTDTTPPTRWIVDDVVANVGSWSKINTSADAGTGPLAIMAGAIRAGFSGDVGLTTSGGTITWTDQAPTPHDITGTGTILPTAQNSMPGLKTNGTSDQLHSTFTIPAPGTSPSYLWTIVRDENHGTFQAIVALSDLNSQSVLKDNGTADACLFDSATLGIRSAPGLTLSTFKRVRASFTGTGTDTLQIGLGAPSTGAAAGNSAGTGIWLGRTNGTYTSNTHLEIWLFSRAPTGPELTELDAWGNAKWAGTFA